MKNFAFVVLTGMEVEDKDLFTFEDEVTIDINTTVLIRLNKYFHTGNVSEMKSYELQKNECDHCSYILSILGPCSRFF